MDSDANFEEQLMTAIKNKIIKEVGSTVFTQLEYGKRQSIPQDILDRTWDSIAWCDVIDGVRDGLQTRICNSIVASMETEVKTDIKKLLCVAGVREKLRMQVYPELMKVLNAKNGE